MTDGDGEDNFASQGNLLVKTVQIFLSLRLQISVNKAVLSLYQQHWFQEKPCLEEISLQNSSIQFK